WTRRSASAATWRAACACSDQRPASGADLAGVGVERRLQLLVDLVDHRLGRLAAEGHRLHRGAHRGPQLVVRADHRTGEVGVERVEAVGRDGEPAAPAGRLELLDQLRVLPGRLGDRQVRALEGPADLLRRLVEVLEEVPRRGEPRLVAAVDHVPTGTTDLALAGLLEAGVEADADLEAAQLDRRQVDVEVLRTDVLVGEAALDRAVDGGDRGGGVDE